MASSRLSSAKQTDFSRYDGVAAAAGTVFVFPYIQYLFKFTLSIKFAKIGLFSTQAIYTRNLVSSDTLKIFILSPTVKINFPSHENLFPHYGKFIFMRWKLLFHAMVSEQRSQPKFSSYRSRGVPLRYCIDGANRVRITGLQE